MNALETGPMTRASKLEAELRHIYERHTRTVFSLVDAWDERDAALERAAELEAREEGAR
jgi:hypothetical protein